MACLALDQGRYEEAIEVFERKHREASPSCFEADFR